MTKHQTILRAAAKLGMNPASIYTRLGAGWTMQEATTVPKIPKGYSRHAATRRVTDRISRTVTTTTRVKTPDVKSYAFDAKSVRIVVDMSKGTLIVESAAA